MKKTITRWLLRVLFLGAGVLPAFAQGTVTFNTYNLNTSLGQCFLCSGVGPGTDFYGQLWWSDTSNGTFFPAGVPQTFDAINPTYILDGSVTVPGRDAGTTLWFSMYVWDSAGGSLWPGPGVVSWGFTPPVSRTLGGVDTEGNIFTPQQFNTFPNTYIGLCPEPTTLELVSLGLLALFVFHHRKRLEPARS